MKEVPSSPDLTLALICLAAQKSLVIFGGEMHLSD